MYCPLQSTALNSSGHREGRAVVSVVVSIRKVLRIESTYAELIFVTRVHEPDLAIALHIQRHARIRILIILTQYIVKVTIQSNLTYQVTEL